MNYTKNYNFKKPALTDAANIGDINDNMDSVDTQIKAVDTQIKAVDGKVDTLSEKVRTISLPLDNNDNKDLRMKYVVTSAFSVDDGSTAQIKTEVNLSKYIDGTIRRVIPLSLGKYALPYIINGNMLTWARTKEDEPYIVSIYNRSTAWNNYMLYALVIYSV